MKPLGKIHHDFEKSLNKELDLLDDAFFAQIPLFGICLAASPSFFMIHVKPVGQFVGSIPGKTLVLQSIGEGFEPSPGISHGFPAKKNSLLKTNIKSTDMIGWPKNFTPLRMLLWQWYCVFSSKFPYVRLKG